MNRDFLRWRSKAFSGPPNLNNWIIDGEYLIDRYRYIHSHGRILILGNGPSGKQHDLRRIDCPIIGLNQAWRMRECDYYCAGDRDQFKMYQKEHGEVESWRPLFTTLRENDDRIMPSHAIKLVPHHVNGRKRFSLDLSRGVYLNNTIASYGFQLAVWMLGEKGTIYLLGIDSTGPSLGGGKIEEFRFQNQRETLAYIRGFLDGCRPDIQVYTLSQIMVSSCFDRMHFNEAFKGGGEF